MKFCTEDKTWGQTASSHWLNKFLSHMGEVAATFMYGLGSLEFSCTRFESKTPRAKR